MQINIPDPQKRNQLTDTFLRFIETVSPEGTFYDTVQFPSGVGDMQLI